MNNPSQPFNYLSLQRILLPVMRHEMSGIVQRAQKIYSETLGYYKQPYKIETALSLYSESYWLNPAEQADNPSQAFYFRQAVNDLNSQGRAYRGDDLSKLNHLTSEDRHVEVVIRPQGQSSQSRSHLEMRWDEAASGSLFFAIFDNNTALRASVLGQLSARKPIGMYEIQDKRCGVVPSVRTYS